MEVEIDFREADRRFTGLKQQFDNGDLSAEEFYAQLEQITVQDAEGRLWAKHRDTGKWHFYNGNTWVRDTPPGYQEVDPEPSTNRPHREAPSPSRSGTPENGEKRRGGLPWLLVAGLAGVVVLIAIVVYLRVDTREGTVMAELPNVVGKPRSDAQRALEFAGFKVRAETQKSSKEHAGEVMKQSPSGAEAEKGSTVTITVGEAAEAEQEQNRPEEASKPAPGYNVIADPTGNLTVEVPPSWGILTGTDSEGEGGRGSWSQFAGEYINSSITTARSIDSWKEAGDPTSGVYMVASRALTQYTDEEIIHDLLYAGKAEKCSVGPYEDFERPPYSGKMQTWYDCGANNVTSFVVAAAPQDRACVVVLGGNVAPDADKAEREAVQHILDSFEVDCEGIAGVRSEDRTLADVAHLNMSVPPGYGGI